MAYTTKLKSTYVKYFEHETGEEKELRLVTHGSNDVRAFYKTDYNTFIPNAINYIIGTFAFSNKVQNKPQTHVYISNKNLAKHIGVSYGHASYIIDQASDIFNLVVTGGRGRTNARTVKLSDTLIDFMQVFSEEELEKFILNHNISSDNQFAVRQVYHYLGWEIAPNKLTPSQKINRQTFMSDEERRNYWHYAATSNYKVQTRVRRIQKNLNLLSEQQQKQFEHLKQVINNIKPGKKLIKYWFKILIKFEQIVSWLTRSKEKAHEDQQHNTSVNDKNNNQDTSAAKIAVTAEHQKKPDSRSGAQLLHFMLKVIMSWNERATRNNLPTVKRLTVERYNLLLAVMEEYNESEILQALGKIEYIHQLEEYDYKFTFNRFMTIDRINYALEYDENSSIAVNVDTIEQLTNNINRRRQYSSLPELSSIKQVNTYLREQIK